jgi:hypothetical protein
MIIGRVDNWAVPFPSEPNRVAVIMQAGMAARAKASKTHAIIFLGFLRFISYSPERSMRADGF